jgi:hypothetical protein
MADLLRTIPRMDHGDHDGRDRQNGRNKDLTNRKSFYPQQGLRGGRVRCARPDRLVPYDAAALDPN